VLSLACHKLRNPYLLNNSTSDFVSASLMQSFSCCAGWQQHPCVSGPFSPHDILTAQRLVQVWQLVDGAWAQCRFFIRDGMAFPDLVHALRPNPKNHIQEVRNLASLSCWLDLLCALCPATDDC